MEQKYFSTFRRNTLLALGFLVVLLLGSNADVSAQVVKPFTQRTSQQTPNKKIYNVKGDFTLLGNTNLTMQNYTTGGSNNYTSMVYVDVDGDTNTLNSSTAELQLSQENGADPSCSNLIYAGLYWTGRTHDGGNSPMSFTVTKGSTTKNFNKREVKIKGPGAGNYQTITANSNDIYYPTSDHGQMYSAYAEVTDYVKQHGIGNYTVADIALREGNGGSAGYYGGWAMIVVYENSKLPLRDVTIFDGHAYVRGGVASYELPVSGFSAVQNGPVNVKLGMIAGEGDRSISGDYFQMLDQNNQWVTLSHSGNQGNNFFNSSIFTGGNARVPNLLNNTGMDISMFDLNNSSKNLITNGQTSTKFKYGSTQDTYIIPLIAMAIDAYRPEPEGIDQVVTINGQPAGSNPVILPGQEMEVSVEIRNKGDEDITNAVVTIPIPFASSFASASGVFYQGLNGPQPYFDPNVGANGSIVWNVGNLPAISGFPLLAKLTYKLKATTDCLILSTPGCALNIPITGTMSGQGALSGVVFTDYQLIQGYQNNGTCQGQPITDPINVEIDAAHYVQANCGGVDPVQVFTFCNVPGGNIPFTDISGFFPAGSRFYNEYPIDNNSIEYTIASGFPATPGSHTYYAIPPGSTTCYFKFKIDVTVFNSVPDPQDVEYCLNDQAVPLSAVPSDPSYNLYFYTQQSGGSTQTTITPSTATVGTTVYYVAEGISAQCVGPRVPLEVIVHDLPQAPTSTGDIIECEADPIQTLDANSAIAPVSGQTIIWYDMASGGTPVANPILNTVGSQTYYAEAISDNGNCSSSSRTPVVLTIIESPEVDDPADVTACDSYTLPSLANGNYFTGSGGTGTPLFAGDNITSTQTIYVYAQTGTTPNCSAENSFVVTINDTPVVDDPADVTACDSYTLLALANGNYFTGSGGTGTPLFAGDNITSTQTIYVYAQTGTTPNCSAENSFVVTINETPVVDDPADVTACDSYTLPALANGNYFTGSGGTGTQLNAGDNITSTQTIYVYAQTGTRT